MTATGSGTPKPTLGSLRFRFRWRVHGMLDTTIANVTSPHIAGNLSATNDESIRHR
jgi:hypothetical protein